MKAGAYTIGQLAIAADVKTSTVRFYERRHMLQPAGRSAGNYRRYGIAALERLRFIRSMQATGFSLRDIAELLELTQQESRPCDDVLELTRKRLAEVKKRIKEMNRMERMLSACLKTCCRGAGPDLCDGIVRLRGLSSKKSREIP